MSADSTGKGSDNRWERLQELFSRAVELPLAERQTFVANETRGDTELRTELLDLLACDAGSARTGPLTLALGAALPLMFGWGEGAELRRPLGLAIFGGLVVSQVLTLFTTPVVYLAFDRMGHRFGRKREVVAE